MPDTLLQKLSDSESNYTNTTFWHIHPLFLLIRDGDLASLQSSLDIQLERFPSAGRISRDAKKQLEYLSVSLVNTFMIAAIQGGVYPPEANAVADDALRKIARIRMPVEIPPILSTAAFRLCTLVREATRSDTHNPHVERARQYLSTHLTQEIHTEDVARAVGLSQYHLCRLFRTLTGMTMRQYLTKERIRTAKQLLAATDTPIPEIATLLRFCDQSHFTLTFRRQEGMTPKEYRNRNQK